jgi:hypothetical protein
MKANAQLGKMHDRLIEGYIQNPKERFCDALLRLVEDPLKPRDKDGRFRVNPILLLLTLVLALALGTFLLLSFVQS